MADDKIGTVNDGVENASKLINKSGNDAVSQGLVSKKQDSSLATVTKTKDSSLATVKPKQAKKHIQFQAHDPKSGSTRTKGRVRTNKPSDRELKGTKAEQQYDRAIKSKLKQQYNDIEKSRREGIPAKARAVGRAASATKFGLDVLTSEDGDEMTNKISGRIKRNIERRVRKAVPQFLKKRAKGATKGCLRLYKKSSTLVGRSKTMAKALASMQKAQVAAATKAAASRGVVAVVMKIIAAIVSLIVSILPILITIIVSILIIIIVVVIVVTLFTVFAAQSSGGFSKLTEYEQPVAQFLKDKGLDNKHIAALIGTWRSESQSDPRQCQFGSFDGTDGNSYNFPSEWHGENSTADEYPQALINNGSFGYGIAQWTYPTRAWGLVNYATEENKKSGDRDLQLNYFWSEFTGDYSSVYAEFLDNDDIDDMVVTFASGFEGNQNDDNYASRKENAKAVFELISSGTGGSTDIVKNAESQLGSYYYWGAEGETINGHVVFDCSGFVKWCYDQAGKTGLAHYTCTIYSQCEIISEEEASPGDIVGWGRGDNCYHVGIYVGDGQCIDACGPTNWTNVPSDYLTTHHSVHYYDGEVWFGSYTGD